MKRPNKQDYTSPQGFAIIAFTDDMIKWGDYMEEDMNKLAVASGKLINELLNK